MCAIAMCTAVGMLSRYFIQLFRIIFPKWRIMLQRLRIIKDSGD